MLLVLLYLHQPTKVLVLVEEVQNVPALSKDRKQLVLELVTMVEMRVHGLVLLVIHKAWVLVLVEEVQNVPALSKDRKQLVLELLTMVEMRAHGLLLIYVRTNILHKEI